MANKSNLEKAKKQIDKHKIKGVTTKLVNKSKFTEKQKEQLKQMRKQMRGGK